MMSFSIFRWWMSYMGTIDLVFEIIAVGISVLNCYLFFKLKKLIKNKISEKEAQEFLEGKIKERISEKTTVFNSEIHHLNEKITDKYNHLIELMNKSKV